MKHLAFFKSSASSLSHCWKMYLKVTVVCSKAFTTKSPSVWSQWCNSISVTQKSCTAQAGRWQHSVQLEALWKICVFLRGRLSWLMNIKVENVLLNDLCASNCLRELVLFLFLCIFCLVREEDNLWHLCEVIHTFDAYRTNTVQLSKKTANWLA